jgi:hypothetical protein
MTPHKAVLWGMLATVVLLTGCASREEIAAKKAAAEQAAQASRETRCTSFGYKSGTPDYSKCLQSMYVQDQQMAAAAEARRQARLNDAATSLQQAGAALQGISPPPQPVIRCNTMPMGPGTTTTCQ